MIISKGSFQYLGICILAAVTIGLAIGTAGNTLALLLIGGLIILGLLQNKLWFAVAIALTPFVSRYGIPVAGTVIRPEMVVGAAALASLLLGTQRQALTRGQQYVIGLLAAWLIFLAVTTQLNAPNPVSSAPVWAWLLFDLSIMVWIAKNDECIRRIVTISIWCASALCLVGIPLWAAAQAGITTWGVQQDYTYGGYAVYVTVYEANIYASLIVLWAIVAMTQFAAHVPTSIRMFLVLAAPIATVAAHTRAALVAWVFAAIVMLFRKKVTTGVKVSLAAAGAFAVAFFANVSATNFDGLSKFVNPFDFSGGTGGYRSDSWQVALSDLSSTVSWLAGLGLNSFGQRHLDPTKISQQEAWYLGNIGIQILYDGGLIAVLLVAGALVLTLTRARSLDALVLTVSFAIVASLTSTLWLSQTWIFAGLALALVGRFDQAQESTKISVAVDRGAARR
ncbi:hypothetical protein SAMN02745947_02513 [Rhodococcus rhodochrous J3]|uniref:O-antigen ligase like membrane protein n=1 Tax=Rhodococcus rhodochrous J3 TaxID=903528 RepID=A0ABY1MCI5_RHORH|nr:hypothetical protein [Rhodococcus rhodochrous]SMG36745.1 hypothetical protein SAMN02745947_02513 [Rhodococcus rhodochrous J3]